MRTLALVGLVSLLGVSGPAWGAWGYVPPQALVDQADYVVLGTLVNVDKKTGQADIKVEQLLKGAAIEKLPVRWLAERPEGPSPARDKFYSDGTRAVWLLGSPEKDGRYSIDQPGRNMSPDQLDKAKAMVADFQAIKWSKPVDGLAGAVRTIPTGDEMPVSTFDLYFAVKNVSDKALTVQQAEGPLHMHFILKGPDGETQIDMEKIERPMTINPVSVRLEPGQVLYVGFSWPAGLPTGTLNPGKYTVTGTYSFMPAMGNLPPKDQWMGKIETEPLELFVGGK